MNSSRKLYIGIDGGGTKTEGVLLDNSGKILSRVKSGASSVIGSPCKESLEVLKNTVDILCSENDISVDEITFCSLGLNGIDFDDEYNLQFKLISEYLGFPGNKFSLVNDAVVALWGASLSPASVILQHGTGITSAFRSDYGSEILFDHLNVCNCYDIRTEALTAVSRMIAGVIPSDIFKDEVLNLFAVNEYEFPELLFRGRLAVEKMIQLPALIYSLWAKGSNYSEYLIEKAIDDYVLLIKAMAEKTGSNEVTAILGGGVVEGAPDKFWSSIINELTAAEPIISLQKREYSPAVGAAIMSAYNTGENISKYYKEVNINGEN